MQDTAGGRIALLTIRSAYPHAIKEAHIIVFLRRLVMLKTNTTFAN